MYFAGTRDNALRPQSLTAASITPESNEQIHLGYPEGDIFVTATSSLGQLDMYYAIIREGSTATVKFVFSPTGGGAITFQSVVQFDPAELADFPDSGRKLLFTECDLEQVLDIAGKACDLFGAARSGGKHLFKYSAAFRKIVLAGIVTVSIATEGIAVPVISGAVGLLTAMDLACEAVGLAQPPPSLSA